MSANDTAITRTVLRIPSITGQPYIIYSGEIAVRDDGHTRYLAEGGYLLTESVQQLGPDNPADEPTRDYEIAAKLGALRRVLQALEAQGVIGAAGLDSTDAHDLAVLLVEAVRG